MKTLIIKVSFLAAICLSAAGCLKDNSNTMPRIDCAAITATAPASETSTLKKRLDSIGISGTIQDPRGFFYTMDSAEVSIVSSHATPCSNVAVTYSLAKLGDAVFERSDSVIAVSLPYTNVTGLKAALPLMRKGATMVLYLPPSLAYGSSGYKTIPGNTYITFTIKLYDFSE